MIFINKTTSSSLRTINMQANSGTYQLSIASKNSFNENDAFVEVKIETKTMKRKPIAKNASSGLQRMVSHNFSRAAFEPATVKPNKIITVSAKTRRTEIHGSRPVSMA